MHLMTTLTLSIFKKKKKSGMHIFGILWNQQHEENKSKNKSKNINIIYNF